MKYLLEYDNFLNEKIDNNLLDQITEFQKNYGNDKDILSKYNLRSLKNKRNAGYQKIYSDIYKKRQIKESSDPLVPVIKRIKEIDDECDSLLYLLCEFRRSMNDLNEHMYNRDNFNTIKGLHKKDIKGLKNIDEMSMVNLFFIFAQKKNKKMYFLPSSSSKSMAAYGNDSDDIFIYYNNIFGGRGKDSIVNFIWGTEENFNRKLETLSNIIYHELTHKYQKIVNPEKYVEFAGEKLTYTNIDTYWWQYYTNPLEIEAHAMGSFKQMYNRYGDYDKILDIIRNNKYDLIPFANSYLKYTGKAIDTFLENIFDIVEYRKKLNI